ncbi:MAG TPA: aminotransferase class I/II-fold pyridoxal phosphate-dependent enzyme [Pseudobdellovibrionaceae bacterium]|nr:aminotransferase class I/II-fold pyridoxal phosphate-dependent enzyme [Pseudobdellovibrionaceae bacterium]
MNKVEMFHSAAIKHFNFFKDTTSLDALYVKSISLKDNMGFLVPVPKLHLENQELIELLTVWRNENKHVYPSQFTATPESTKSWLKTRLLETPDRMLFLIYNKVGKLVGHIGYANVLLGVKENKCLLEIDNVIRGIKEIEPGIMSNAMNSLIDWANEKLLPDEIYLRVFSDNKHAIDFYLKNSFIKNNLIPLYKETRTDGVYFSEEPKSSNLKPEAEFQKMTYSPSAKKMGDELILTAGPSISAMETYYAYDAAKTGWNNKWNFYIKKFETEFSEYIGVQHALSTSSCTGALHLALLTLGIGAGDEVIVPDITWVATANAVAYTGATPIFADIDQNTWCLDPESVKKKITEKTKAIMPVHLYGHSVDMDSIMKIARDNKLYVVEDAAPAIGASWNGKKTGSFGDFAAFSFQGAKLTVTGEGGMLVTNNKDLYLKAYSLWDQGRDLNKTFWINETGWKYKMSNVQAAIGLGQLQRVEELIHAKRRVFDWYHQNLKNNKNIKLCYEPKNSRSIYWMSSLQVLPTSKLNRDQLRDELKKRNVDTRPVFPAISRYPIWKYTPEVQPIANEIGNTAINLPSGVCLSKDQVEYVCKMINELT